MKENKMVGFYISHSGNRMDKVLRTSHCDQIVSKLSTILWSSNTKDFPITISDLSYAIISLQNMEMLPSLP